MGEGFSVQVSAVEVGGKRGESKIKGLKRETVRPWKELRRRFVRLVVAKEAAVEFSIPCGGVCTRVSRNSSEMKEGGRTSRNTACTTRGLACQKSHKHRFSFYVEFSFTEFVMSWSWAFILLVSFEIFFTEMKEKLTKFFFNVIIYF